MSAIFEFVFANLIENRQTSLFSGIWREIREKNSKKNRRKMQNSTKKLNKKSEIQSFNRENILAISDEKIEIRERCKGVHCVDLGESFPTSIYLQKSASIQPRTSSSKFGGKLFNIIHSCP